MPFYVDGATPAGGRVLELGSGTGRILLPIARAGHAIVRVDSSAQMLAYGDFNRAPLAENSPEHIVCAERV